MSTGFRPEPSERKQSVGRWLYLPIANGASVGAYTAGPIALAPTHYVNQTRPCRAKMSHAKLVCPFCETHQEVTWRGYVPLYDRDFVRRFVLISLDYLEAAELVELHQQVKCVRGKNKRDAVIVRGEQWTPTALPVTQERRDPQDIWPFLLRMWKDQELAIEVRRIQAAPLPGTVKDIPAAIAARKDYPQWVKTVQDDLSQQEVGKSFDEVLSSLASDSPNHPLKASANGKHKKR